MKRRILLVDDFAISNDMVRETLNYAGYEVITAIGAFEALKCIKAMKIDLVITDYRMPKMNGIELVAEIKKLENYQFTPVIILSGDKNETTKQEAYEAGITAWIQKPFKMENFVKIVERIFK